MNGKNFLLTLMFCLSVFATHPCSGFTHISFTVYVSPQHNSARVNSIFSINISVADVPEPGLWAYEFKVYYNKSLLEPLSAEIPAGHFLEPVLSPDNLFLVDSGTINQTEGTVSFAATLVNPELGKTGSGALANITFVVVAPGNCTLRIGGYITDEPKFVDGNGDPIPSCQISIVDGYFEGFPPPPPPISPPTPEAGWETVAFDFMGIYGYLTFPQECHVNDTLTYQLILAAEPDGIHVNYFKINVSCNTFSGEKTLYAEKLVQNKDLAEDWSLNKSIILTVPNDAYGKLYCVVEADTYKRFTTCDSALRFYTTQIRTLTYEELFAAYQLVSNQYNTTVEKLNYWLAEYDNLNNTYHQLWTDYRELLNQYNSTVEELNHWITEYQELNNTYCELLTNYDSLNSNYRKLETDYNSLKSTYQSLEASYNSLNSSYNSLKKDYILLQADYNNLQNAFNSLNSTYIELFWNYTGLAWDFKILQDKMNSLQTDFNDLSNAYNSLNSTYHNLLNEYESLKSQSDAAMNELQSAKALWGLLLATTMVATVSAIYLLMKSLRERRLRSENSSIKA